MGILNVVGSLTEHYAVGDAGSIVLEDGFSFVISKHFCERIRQESTDPNRFDFESICEYIKSNISKSIVILNRQSSPILHRKNRKRLPAIYLFYDQFIFVVVFNHESGYYNRLKTAYSVSTCDWFKVWKKQNLVGKILFNSELLKKPHFG